MTSWHQFHPEECFYQLFIPGLTPVSQLGRESGFEVITQFAETIERPLWFIVIPQGLMLWGILTRFSEPSITILKK
jgi:hypothetical protein